jgi:Ca2+-binding RTX toxin-like protein
MEINGTAGNDIIPGTADFDLIRGRGGDDLLSGAEGDDKLYGGIGDDTLQGDNGADTLNGGAGLDRLIGGVGDDRYYVDAQFDIVTENLGEGTETVYSYATNFKLPANVEDGRQMVKGSLEGNAQDNDLRISVGGTISTLSGRDGNDILRGNTGNEVLSGGAGVDSVFGLDGNDLLYGNAGNDDVRGGGGDDVLYGDDEVGLETGDDLLCGNAGNDELYGGNGHDRLLGGDGYDIIEGGDGDDLVIGGVGQDTLSGGAGADEFRYVDGDLPSFEQILDFARSEGDLIDLSRMDADSALAGNQTFAFIGTDSFSGTAGELRYFAAGSTCYLEGDLDGNGTGEFLLAIGNNTMLVESDFVL